MTAPAILKNRSDANQQGRVKMYGQDHREVIAKLARLFPKAFFEEPRQRVPLKANITADIEKLGCADLIGVDVAGAVDFYMTHIGYQICSSTAGRTRVDLDGNPIKKVTAQEAAVAQRKASEAGQNIQAKRIAFSSNANGAIDPGINLMRKVPTVREDEKRANQSPADLLAGATKKLARATSLLDSEEDEFKAMFLEKVLKETKADLDAMLARLRA
jgi:sRNA-binding protein